MAIETKLNTRCAVMRYQRNDETIVVGPRGFYFVAREGNSGKRSVYRYEYFGASELKSGYAHLTKRDTLAMLRDRLADS